MPEPEKVLEVVAEWVTKAENDLITATHTLTLGEACPTDTVCFHAQQCVEKYLKAVLVSELIECPKTHDLETLIALVPARLRPRLTAEEQRRLTAYATVGRYPGWRDVPLAEARRAVTLARRARNDLRARLPRGASRRTRV
jgi:HEPN domain-containing protein